MVQASRLHPRHADLTDTLRRICREHGVDRIVVGVPANMDGSLGERARLSLELAQSLRDELGIEVETWDERLTTRQAERAMLEGDLTRKKRKERIDRLAAQLMLQSYLDAQRSRP
jgi:putative Holliday junction resolvase